MPLKIEWDRAKSKQTQKMRGFRFEIIKGFDWQYAILVAVQFVEQEERELWIGPIEARLYAAVFSFPEEKTFRLISLRRASNSEIRIWRGEIHHG